ncbi:MAG: DUF6077 domain-containing protein [Lachnospiraceae bacterium]|nr:DUF6077 domain-containing protein [Lachnospiraceae bacterium]
MLDIIKIIIIFYMILVFPFLLGTLWQKYIVKRHLGIGTLVQGWLCMMALFYCESVPMILFRRSLSELKNIWLITTVVITILFLLLCFGTRKQRRNMMNLFFKKWKCAVIPVLLILCSILFLQPVREDDTLEIVMDAIASDTMYQHQPYTGERYEEVPQEQAFAPLEMYYAVLFEVANANPAIIVRILIPFGFLPICIITYVLWARRLFPKNPQGQRWFLIFAGIISLFPIVSTDMGLLRIWQSCWKGDVLLATTVLPLMCSYVYLMIRELSQQYSGRTCGEYALKLLVASLTAQLMDAKGMLYSCMIIISGVLILVVRRWQKKYAANPKCN